MTNFAVQRGTQHGVSAGLDPAATITNIPAVGVAYPDWPIQSFQRGAASLLTVPIPNMFELQALAEGDLSQGLFIKAIGSSVGTYSVEIDIGAGLEIPPSMTEVVLDTVVIDAQTSGSAREYDFNFESFLTTNATPTTLRLRVAVRTQTGMAQTLDPILLRTYARQIARG